MFKLSRSGGIWFWSIGRLGGSLYFAKSPKAQRDAAKARRRAKQANTREAARAWHRLGPPIMARLSGGATVWR